MSTPASQFKKAAHEALSNLTGVVLEAFNNLAHRIKAQNADITRFKSDVAELRAEVAELRSKVDAMTRQGFWIQ